MAKPAKTRLEETVEEYNASLNSKFIEYNNNKRARRAEIDSRSRELWHEFRKRKDTEDPMTMEHVNTEIGKLWTKYKADNHAEFEEKFITRGNAFSLEDKV